jgi:hypothetical protein
MKKPWLLCVVFMVAAATVPLGIANEGGKKFRGLLSGFQEVPTLATASSGEIEGKIEKNEMSISYTLSYEDLEAPTLFAHIHIGARGTNGGVMVFLCGGGGKPACPALSGTVDGVIVPADVIGPAGQGVGPAEFSEVIRTIRAGAAYANVHTTKFPGGEIRGQLKADDIDTD